MKMLACCVVAAGVACAAGGAAAADFPAVPFVGAPLGVYNWTGGYVGEHFGYEWASTTRNPTDPSGVAGGFHGGYNLQSGQFVVGGEADITFSAADDHIAPYQFSNPWFGTLRARAGYALNNILLYGTAGFAYGGVHAEGFGLTEDRTLTGWTAGGGVEVGLARNWSARIEYLFISLNDRHFVVTGTTNGLESNLFRMGLDFRF
jgi:outer membrane immunogenic protein